MGWIHLGPPGVALYYSQYPFTHDPERETIILLGPAAWDCSFFRPQFDDPVLIKNYNLVTIDHHYNGRSRVPISDGPYDPHEVVADLIIGIEKLGITKAHVWGASLGATLAMHMAAMKPDLVKSLILVGCYSPSESPDTLDVVREMRDENLNSGEISTDIIATLINRFLGAWADARVVNEVTKSFERQFNGEGRWKTALSKQWSQIIDRKPLTPAENAKITMPVVIIAGEADLAYPPESSTPVLCNLLKATKPETHVIKDAPHFLSSTHARQVTDIAVEFIQRASRKA